MRLADLLPPAVVHSLPASAASLVIDFVAHDSRRCRPHTLFAAWRGERVDGHQYVDDARAAGAAFVLCERPLEASVPHVVVAEPRRLLALAAARLYQEQTARLRLVGITGTNGKTTCAHVVASVLAHAGASALAIGTLGESRLLHEGRIELRPVPGSLTTPEAADVQALLAEAAARADVGAAIEVTSIALAQGRIEGLSFDVGAMTNLTQDHLDVHHTMEAYGRAKTRLFTDHLKPGGVCVWNAGDAFQRGLRQQLPQHRALWYGTRARHEDVTSDVYPEQVQLLRDGMQLRVRTPRGALDIGSPLVGDFNVENVLLAVAVGIALELPSDAITGGIAALRAIPGRLERFGGNGQAPLVLVDYAHTPDALQRSLAVARALTPSGRVLCVFGCGGDRDAQKRPLMGRIASEGADEVFVTNDNPRRESPAAIAEAIVTGMAAGHATLTVELDRAQAIRLALRNARASDTVLVAGKGHEPYQIVGTTSHAFDDRQQVREALATPRGI